MRGWAALAGALVLALALGACGGTSDRDAVRDYVTEANAVQREGSAGLDAANAAYRRFSQGRRPGPLVAARLEETVEGLLATRERLARLDAPDAAATLRRRLLAVFDRNVELAREAAQLGTYVPAAGTLMGSLPALGRTLQRGLDRGDPGAQGRALDRYGRRLAGLERRMRDLAPPPVLVASHRSQLARLERARSLARRLRAALAGGDAATVARLLLRFRGVYTPTGLDRRLQREAIRAYRGRLQDVNRAVAAVRREQQRLDRSLG